MAPLSVISHGAITRVLHANYTRYDIPTWALLDVLDDWFTRAYYVIMFGIGTVVIRRVL